MLYIIVLILFLFPTLRLWLELLFGNKLSGNIENTKIDAILDGKVSNPPRVVIIELKQ